MSRFNRILCPVDLSENSLKAVELASTIAKSNNSKIVFLHVAPGWIPDEAALGGEYIRQETEIVQQQFENIKPTDTVPFEHVFRQGNAGPEIVNEANRCDMVVMSTHGYGAVMRLLMGSVAQYTMRNANCPVILVKNHESATEKDETGRNAKRFATNLMRQVAPIREFDDMNEVIVELEDANQTAAPVVNVEGKAIGILTETDIAKYKSLLERFRAKDESVVKEIYEVDQYGHVRVGNRDFNQVKRHMSSPVVTISNSESVARAQEMFEADQEIHHLLVVDEQDRPLGVLTSRDCERSERNRPAEIDVSIRPIAN